MKDINAPETIPPIAATDWTFNPTKRPEFEKHNCSTLDLCHKCLPFHLQHRILVSVQDSLEKARYAFAQRLLADMLQKEGWNCPEAVELNQGGDSNHEIGLYFG